jgi:hypothetical protein
VLLHQGVFAMEGDGVEVQIKRGSVLQPPLPHDVQPIGHELAVALRPNAATVFGEEGSFGNDIQAGEEPESLIQNVAHHLAVPGIAEEL